MFPDKAKMVRNANALLLVLAVAPVVYMVIAALVTFGKGGLARDPSIVPWLFYGLVIVSLVNIGTMVFIQTSKGIMSERGRYDPVGRTFFDNVDRRNSSGSTRHIRARPNPPVRLDILRDRILSRRVGMSLVGQRQIQDEPRKTTERIVLLDVRAHPVKHFRLSDP